MRRGHTNRFERPARDAEPDSSRDFRPNLEPNLGPHIADTAEPPLDAAALAALAAAAEVEAAAEREARRAAVLRQIRKLIDFHGVSREELGTAPDVSLPPTPAAELPPKYRHPVSGETWDGVGAHPDWLRKALLQEGYRVAELRVADASGSDQPDPTRA